MTDKEFLEKLFLKALSNGYERRLYKKTNDLSFSEGRNRFEFDDWCIDLATVIFDHSFHRALGNISIRSLLGFLVCEEHNSERIIMLRDFYNDLILEEE